MTTVTQCLAGTYATAGQSSCSQCTAGKECPTAGMTSDGTNCAAGSASSTGASSCTGCTAGNWQDLTGQSSCKQCTAGKECAGASRTTDGATCAAGTFSSAGQASCTQCTAGKQCPGTGRTSDGTPCAAGTFSAAGQASCTSCTAGNSCPGTSRTTDGSNCAAGTWSAAGQASCTACSAGRACTGAGRTTDGTQCAAGSYQSLTGQTACVTCPAGYYCPLGSVSPTACPSGTYRAATAGAIDTDCIETSQGYYVTDGGTTKTLCEAGYRCPTSRNPVRVPCNTPTEYQDLAGQTSCKTCIEGNICPTRTQTFACPAGSWCLSGAATACAGGDYCPSSTSRAADCPAGSYCSEPHLISACTTVGRFCPKRSTSETLCPAGFFCTSSVKSEACPAGYYCPAGSSAALDCPAGNYCAAQVASPTLCPPGTFCPVRSTLATTCPVGTYCPVAGTAAALSCIAGDMCPEGSASATPCPAGSYCPTFTSTPMACAKGDYCPTRSFAVSDCAGGYYCATPADRVSCSVGFYCPVRSTAPIRCSLRSLCNVTGMARPRARTVSTSLSLSREVYCGDLDTEHCNGGSAAPCTLGNGTRCFARRCSDLSPSAAPTAGDKAVCLRQGCTFNMTSSRCENPENCTLITSQAPCTSTTGCAWVRNACESIRKPCPAYALSRSVCLAQGCAWNEKLAVACFLPLYDSSLCVLQDSEIGCSVRSCLWSQVAQRCLPWDVTCANLPMSSPPTSAACSIIPLCTYNASSQACQAANTANFDINPDIKTIVQLTMPKQATPGVAFQVQVIGSEMTTSNIAILVPVGDSCPAPANVTAASATDGFFVSDNYVASLRRSSFTVIASQSLLGRNVTLCVKTGAKSVVKADPTVMTLIERLPAEVLTCPSVEPPFAGQASTFSLVGNGLDADSQIALVPATSACPVSQDANKSIFVTIVSASADGTQARARYSLSTAGSFKLCYSASRSGNVVSCPTLITVSGTAPWDNAASLLQIANRSFATFDNQTVAAFNTRRCQSMSGGKGTSGIMMHPSGMRVSAGDGKTRMQDGEVCIWGIDVNGLIGSDSLPAGSSKERSPALVFDLVNYGLDASDEVRLMVPKKASAPVACALFTTQASCQAQACQWSTTTQACTTGLSDRTGCPAAADGYDVARVLTLNRVSTLSSLSLSFSADQPVFVVMCGGATDRFSTQLVLDYRAQTTFCPNDCKHADGTTRGTCASGSTATGYACQCFQGYSGSDCSRDTVCKGRGAAASTIAAEEGKETIVLSSAPCGALISATTPPLFRSLPYGIGVSIYDVSLSSANCSDSYIVIRSATFSGPVLRRICKSDLADTIVFRTLAEDTQSVYVEFAGRSEAADKFTIEYRSVSLTCPGKTALAGVPQTDAEKCDGRGKCVPLDFAGSATLLPAAYGCACETKWAASSLTSTCDICAFGYATSTFPTCQSATACARGCSGRGVCSDSGCTCPSGFYGLDCELDVSLTSTPPSVYTTAEPAFKSSLTAGAVGNSAAAGGVDRTMVSCQMPGSSTSCAEVEAPANSIRNPNDAVAAGAASGSRRQTNATRSPNTTTTTTTANVLMFNPASTGLTTFFPDFIRVDNVTGTPLDLSGEITVTGWIKATPDTFGFLFAKVDSAFYVNGQSPVLDKAIWDAAQRTLRGTSSSSASASAVVAASLAGGDAGQLTSNRDMTPLDAQTLHLGVLLVGNDRRVDIIVTDAARRESKIEPSYYTRSFRLGSAAGSLYDDKWHYMAVVFSNDKERPSAQVYIDGKSSDDDTNFRQCVPFLPGSTSKRATAPSNYNASASGPWKGHDVRNNTQLTAVTPGASVLWAYHYHGGFVQHSSPTRRPLTESDCERGQQLFRRFLFGE